MQQSPLQPTPVGAFRFNTDSSKLEYYDGNQWVNITSTSPQAQTGGTRALVGGGYDGSSYYKNIDYFNVESTGNAADFGELQNLSGWLGALADRTRGIFLSDGNSGGSEDNTSYVTIASTGNAATFGNLTVGNNYASGLADNTRGVRGGGYPSTDVIDYCTIQSTGDWKDFGNLTVSRLTHGCGVSSPTRGIWGGGDLYNPSTTATNRIDYITISTTGNFLDFGNLTASRLTHGCGVSSPTRGIWGGGDLYNPSTNATNTVDYITISTTGNAADFGDLSVTRKAVAGCANAVRGIWSGGYNPTYLNTMDYLTLATLGNATDFGDSTWTGAYKSGASSPTRGTWSGGRVHPSPGRQNIIDYTQIMTTGNAIDFGDLTAAEFDGAGGCSNGHGGLG